MNKKLIAGAFSCLLLATGVAAAADDAPDAPWEVRLRALYLDPANHSDGYAALGIPEDAIHINSKVIPDLDFEYYFAKHLSTELLLTYPQKQTVTVEKSALGGPTPIGTFNHLPPTLTLKYGFLPDAVFRPYLGVGVNFTLITDVRLAVPTVGNLDLKRTSVGPAGQAGFDWKISDRWFLNADAKYVMLRSDVTFAGATIAQARIDPWLLGVGIGYRFGGSPAPLPPPAPAPVPTAAPAPQASPPPPPPPPPPAPAHKSEEVVLKGVNFATASAKLTPQSTQVLDDTVRAIKQCACSKIAIRGYTDSVGKPEYNQKLSERRAQAVMQYFVDHGVSADMLTAEGFGEQNPIASNSTAAGRAQNRRVTVQFTETVSQ